MTATPLVSVVLPTRNRCRLLVGALASLVDQDACGITYEVIVVDNNSSDDTAAVVQQFQRRSGRTVHYVCERREGVSYARNAGIAVASGDIVSFTDDDIRVDRRWIAVAARRLAENEHVDYVGGPVLPRWASAPPAWLTRDHWSPIAAVDYGTGSFAVPTDRPVCLITANLFIRRAALDRVRWFDPRFPRCQDRELMLRLWAAGLKGLYAPDVVTYTEVPPERMTRAYHRRWHQMHGYFLAQMPLRERRVKEEWIVEPATRGRFVLGVPLFEVRALSTHASRWCGSILRRRFDDAFARELQLRYSLAFVLASLRARQGRNDGGRHHDCTSTEPELYRERRARADRDVAASVGRKHHASPPAPRLP